MKKTQTYFLTALAFLLCTSLFSQEKKLTNLSQVKLYMNGFYSYDEGALTNRNTMMLDYYFKEEIFEFGMPSLALEFDAKNFLVQEFEWALPKISYTDELEYFYSVDDTLHEDVRYSSGARNTDISTALSYQLTYYLLKDKRIMPYLGLSSRLFYHYTKFRPLTTYYFNTIEHNLGICLAIVPGISIRLSEKIALDFNIPFGLYTFQFQTRNNENPLLPIQDRKQSTLSGNFLSDHAVFRIGLAYRLQ